MIPPRISWRNGLDIARRAALGAAHGARPITFANYVSAEKRDILSLAAYVADLLDPTRPGRTSTGCAASGGARC